MWSTIILCTLFGVFILVAYSLGLKNGQKLSKSEEVIVPELNPVKSRFLPKPQSALKCLEPEPTIKDFDILKELGCGSFGRVFLAYSLAHLIK